jgi:hypothetical protein
VKRTKGWGLVGFWNIKAGDLREGDEIRVTVMGGEEYLTVVEVKLADGKVTFTAEWGWHIPVAERVVQELDATEPLTVRR